VRKQLQGVIVMGIMTSILAACAGERPNNLGVKDGALAACPSSPNCVASQAADQGHRIEPFRVDGEPDSAFARLRRILSLRRDTTVIDGDGRYLRVEFRTRLGFVDDGEFLLSPDRRVIHLRSAARLGYSDLGKNRSRLEDIRREFTRAEEGK
jgi:uncharacterized protein (DUF1499 family)